MPKPDPAHVWTDEQLSALGKRIAAEYKKAADELTDKIDAYFKSFAKRDEEQKQLIGTIVNGKEYTEQDYKQWRLAQIGRGQRFEALRDRLAERMTNANEVAAAYINGDMPKIYAMNHAYTIRTVKEQAGGLLVDVDFALFDEQTVRRLIVEQPDLMPYYPEARAIKRKIDLAYGKRQITSVVTSGILQGQSINKMARNLMDRVTDMNRTSAVRAARTAITEAENAGRQAASEELENKGVILGKRWMAINDNRTRHYHAEADGQTVKNDEPFIVGGERLMFPGDRSMGASGWNIYNCFVGETFIASDSEVVRSYKHEYHGELVTVKSSAGVEFTCTLNHPILTPSGWVPAKLLQNGDNILVTFRGEVGVLGVNPDIKHTFPRIDAIHNLFDVDGVKRTCGMMVNFHGDIPTSNVEIITQKRFLRNYRDSSGGNCVNKFLLILSDKALVCKSTLMKHFRRIRLSTFSLICRKSKAFSFLRRCLRHSDIHRLGTPTDRNITIPEYSIDDLPTETIIRSELLDRLPGKVFLDKIVSVKISSKDTHVYNLQTESGYYFVNSIIPQSMDKCNGIFAIAKNCRCTRVTEVVGFKSILTADQRKRANIRVD